MLWDRKVLLTVKIQKEKIVSLTSVTGGRLVFLNASLTSQERVLRPEPLGSETVKNKENNPYGESVTKES